MTRGEISGMQYRVEVEREVDGRWIAEVTEVPGAMCYGATREEAIARAEALALQVVSKRPKNDRRMRWKPES